jgi:hypothetical protein
MDMMRRTFPIANFVLTALRKKAASDDPAFSRAERALYVACTFWAAVARHRLAAHLGSEAEARLRAAGAAFSAIGAAEISAAVAAAVAELPQPPSPVWLQERAGILEFQLLGAGDSLDELIAQFVTEHLSAESSAEPRRRVSRPPRIVQGQS